MKPCIAICTCDRHEMLAGLLKALSAPRYRDVPIIIVDNGAAPAQEVVDAFRPALDIRYERLSETGLCPARNRALAMALDLGATHAALIDDDEYPAEGWLDALLAKAGEAEIVYGPVLPDYKAPPPKWVEESGIFVRTGAVPGTCNVLLALSCLPEDRSRWFLNEFSTSGGEDREFLKRLAAGGARTAIASDALAYEQIPPSRMTMRFILRRGLRDGTVDAKLIRLMRRTAASRMKGGAAFVCRKLAYALNHAFWGVLGQRWHLYMAAGDVATAAGFLATLAGIRMRFYGRPNIG